MSPGLTRGICSSSHELEPVLLFGVRCCSLKESGFLGHLDLTHAYSFASNLVCCFGQAVVLLLCLCKLVEGLLVFEAWFDGFMYVLVFKVVSLSS